jgi:uncharacterized small protein (DUF1192 family)
MHTIGYSEEQISELKKEIHRTRDEQLAHITSMVRAKTLFQSLRPRMACYFS